MNRELPDAINWNIHPLSAELEGNYHLEAAKPLIQPCICNNICQFSIQKHICTGFFNEVRFFHQEGACKSWKCNDLLYTGELNID